MTPPGADDERQLMELVRGRDRERYLTALFAPSDRRAAILALFAFNHEIAKVREIVTEAPLGRIRLQWWREGIEAAYSGGPVRSHEVLTPLIASIREFRLARGVFDRMIDAREQDLQPDPPATLSALESYAADTSGALQSLVLGTLSASGDAAVQAAIAAGCAYGLAGLVRAIPFHARAKRQYIPHDMAKSEGLDLRDLFELRWSPPLARITEKLAAAAEDQLTKARSLRQRIPRAALPALLPATLAAVHLRRLRRAQFNVFDPRVGSPNPGASLYLTIAAYTGRY